MQQLAIQIGEDYLDLFPDTKLEIEEQNPFLQFGTDVVGPYSLPFEVPHTDNNVRLLKLINYLPAKKIDISFKATIWENGIQHSNGTLKIESIKGNLNNLRSGSTSLFYLTGSSTFYDKVGTKKVSDFEYGGDRVFGAINNFQGGYFDAPSGSFGEYLTAVLASDHTTSDFAFFPVLNDSIGSDDGVDKAGMVNNVVSIAGLPRMNLWSYNAAGHNPIMPFPYLLYVIKKIFSNLGWSIEGDILEDPDFKKICLLSYRDIYWCSRSTHNVDHSQVFLNSKYPTTSFNLKNYMPSVTVSQFLIALKDRFGLWYDFDLHAQKCTVRYLRDIVVQGGEDITDMVETSYINKIDNKGKVFSLTQNLDSGDSTASSTDFESLVYIGEFKDDPGIPAISDNVGKYYLRLRENCFYICRPTEADLNVCAWERYTDNIWDLLPEGKTDTIVTAATTVAQERIRLTGQHYHAATPVLEGIFPRSNVSGIWTTKNEQVIEWPIRLIFYHGIMGDVNGVLYPYASNHPVDNLGNKIGAWSLSYKSKDIDTGNENGLFDVFWKGFLGTLKQNETITIRARFPFSIKNQINFGDPKLIQFSKYFVKAKRSVIPYEGSMDLDLIRV